MRFIRLVGIIFCTILIFITFFVFFAYFFPDSPRSQVEVSTLLLSLMCFVFSIVQLRFLQWIISFSPKPESDLLHEKYSIIDIKEKELSFKEFIVNWKFEKFTKFKLMNVISGIGQLILAIVLLIYTLESFYNNEFDSIIIYSFLLLVVVMLFYLGSVSLFLLYRVKRVKKY